MSNAKYHASVAQGVQSLVHFYENLSVEQLDQLPSVYTAKARFKDPFHQVQGVDKIRKIFAHMFATLHQPRFVVTEQLVQGPRAFLVWEFHFEMRKWRKGVPQCICGGSLLHFDAQGLVIEHQDYWDAAQELYEKMPLIGPVMRYLRKSNMKYLDE